MLYVFDEPWQTVVSPVIVPGWAGVVATVTLNVLAVPEPHELLAVTEMVPPDAPAVASIDVDVELPVHPEGNVHVYDVAPETAAMLYVLDEPWQTVVDPVMAPGWAGIGVTETFSILAVLDPHELLAVTEIVPPDAPAVASIDVEVELPVHPDGSDQV